MKRVHPDTNSTSTAVSEAFSPPVSSDTLKVDTEIEPEVDSPLVLTKDSTFPELSVAGGDSSKLGGASSTGSQDDDSSCSCGGETRDSSAFPKAFEHELLTPDTYPHSPIPPQSSSQEDSSRDPSPKSTTASTESHEQPPHEGLHESLSAGLHGHHLMTIDEDNTTDDNTTNVPIGKTASRNVSCDSAVSVGSEVDLIIGSDGGGIDRAGKGDPQQQMIGSNARLTSQHSDETAQSSRKQKVCVLLCAA